VCAATVNVRFETCLVGCTPAVQEVEGNSAAPRGRLGDLGGPVVEDPAAPHSATRMPREGEDISTTSVVRAFEWKGATPEGGVAASVHQQDQV
jgi:hypothetical protein